MMIDRITGHLLLLMAPMASGKGSLVTYMENTFPHVRRTVSCTTRVQRPREREGVDYYFISQEEFKAKIAEDAFVEWAEFSGHLYGTLKSELVTRLQAGEIVVCEIDLQGVRQLIQMVPKEHYTLLYIDAGDWETLKARALARAPISDEHLLLRYERYTEEESFKSNADFIIQNNDGELDKAKAQVHGIVDDIILKTAT